MRSHLATCTTESRGGDDLAFGVAIDFRLLPMFHTQAREQTPIVGFYVQQANSNCVADLDGLLPWTSATPSNPTPACPTRGGTVVADSVHDAFFFGDLRFNPGDDSNFSRRSQDLCGSPSKKILG